MTEREATTQSESTIVRSRRESNEVYAAAFARWLYVRHKAEHTQRDYGASVKRLLDFLGPNDVREVTHQGLRLFIGYLGNLSPNTISFHVKVMRQFFRFLALSGAIRFSPATFLRTPKVGKRLPRFLSQEEVQRFLRAAVSPRERALAELLYATGCRA